MITRFYELPVGARFEFRGRRYEKFTADNLPARQWAKAAVQTIEKSERRLFFLKQTITDFGSCKAFLDWCVNNGFQLVGPKAWFEEMSKSSLEQLCEKTLHRWKTLIKKMIREELPDFHTYDVWKNQRRSAEASGRGTPGAIKSRILDDICDALESLVPENAVDTNAPCQTENEKSTR